MRSLGRRTSLVAGLMAVAALVVACTSAPSSAPPPSASARPATGEPPPTTGSPSPSTTGPQLPRSCDRLIDYTTVLDASGGVLEGESTFVYAGPLASGRTGRITCGYGVVAGPDGKPGPAKIEITLNGYDSADTAQFRFDFSISRARDQGQRIESVDLDGRAAVLISDPTDTSMVVLDQDKTLVVTILSGVVPGSAIKPAMFEIAAAVLDLPQVPQPTD